MPDVFGSAYLVSLNFSTPLVRCLLWGIVYGLGSEKGFLRFLGMSIWVQQLYNYHRATVAGFLADQWRKSVSGTVNGLSSTIFQHGQVRHLPFPLLWKRCWTSCPSPGTYQNGAFWATPLNWVLEALDANVMYHECTSCLLFQKSFFDSHFSSNALLQGFHTEASAIASAAASSFISSGVAECINTDVHYSGAADYVASATNLLGAVYPSS